MPETQLLPCRRWSRRRRDTEQQDSRLFQVGLEPALELGKEPGKEQVLALVPELEQVPALEQVLELVPELEQEQVLVWRRRQR